MCLMLGIAYGIVMAVVSIYLNKERGIDEQQISRLASYFSGGIAVFAVPMGALVRVLSPRVMLAVALVGYGVATAVFPFLGNELEWGVARAVDGAFSVAAWISIETILLMRTTALNRGFITSLYSIVLASGYVLGSVFAAGFEYIGPTKLAFVCAGVLACVSAILGFARLDRHLEPVAGSDHVAHEAAQVEAKVAVHGEPVGALRLYWKIKTACITAFTYGYFQGALVLFLPLFLIDYRGVGQGPTKLLVAFFGAGMAASVLAVGRIGDRHGHLKTIRALVAIGAVITVSVVYLPWFPVVGVMVFFAGAVLAPVYPLSIALQSVIAEPRDYNRSNALLNVSYGLGTLLGPLVCGHLYLKYKTAADGSISPLGGEMLFWQLAVLWLVVLLVSSVFRRDDPSHRPRRL